MDTHTTKRLVDANYTRFSVPYIEKISSMDLPASVFRVSNCIYRNTIGYETEYAAVAITTCMKFTKLSKPTVLKAIGILRNLNIIKLDTSKYIHKYAINLDVDLWKSVSKESNETTKNIHKKIEATPKKKAAPKQEEPKTTPKPKVTKKTEREKQTAIVAKLISEKTPFEEMNKTEKARIVLAFYEIGKSKVINVKGNLDKVIKLVDLLEGDAERVLHFINRLSHNAFCTGQSENGDWVRNLDYLCKPVNVDKIESKKIDLAIQDSEVEKMRPFKYLFSNPLQGVVVEKPKDAFDLIVEKGKELGEEANRNPTREVLRGISWMSLVSDDLKRDVAISNKARQAMLPEVKVEFFKVHAEVKREHRANKK